MKTKRWLAFMLIVLLVLTVSACGGESADADEAEEVTETDEAEEAEEAEEVEETTEAEESTGSTLVFDYRDEGEVFFDYPASYSHSDSTGLDTFMNPDETITVRFNADISEDDVNASVEYFESYNTFEEFRQEELTIAGYEALRIYFIGDWGDYEMSTLIKLGEEAGYSGALFYVETAEEELLSDPEVMAMIESIRTQE